MNRHILFIALICTCKLSHHPNPFFSIRINFWHCLRHANCTESSRCSHSESTNWYNFLYSKFPTNIMIDDGREEELVLLPEILDRLEGVSSDESDLGPELPEGGSITPISNGEPNLMEMEDDSIELFKVFLLNFYFIGDYADNIYNESHEKNLLNIDDNEAQIGEADEENDASTDSSDSNITTGGDIEESEDDLKGGIETTAVEVNGNFHEFEVSPCVVIQIPINQTSVRVILQNVLNSGRAMLTDKKYENCLELIEFECPENTSFCKSKNIQLFRMTKNIKAQNFEDDATEFLLDQEACGVDNAYLYVSPTDIEQTILYKVKVEDNGGN